MSKALKGMAIEDLIATLLTSILFIVFIMAAITSNQGYLKKIDTGERMNAASSIASRIFIEHNGVISNQSENLSPSEIVKVVLLDQVKNITYTSGSIGNSSEAFSSSLAILVFYPDEQKYNPGRLDVYVGK